MKWIFIVLLLVNVVYLGWELDRQATIDIRNNRAVSVIPDSAHQLQLLHETDVQPESRRQDNAESQTENSEGPIAGFASVGDLVAELPDILLSEADQMLPDTKTCYRYGPLLDEDRANELNLWFSNRNVPARILYTEEPGARLFWIYLAPQGSREHALAVVKEMQGKGLGDYRLINRGALENAISLGLFSSREAVDARLRELEQQGYVPVVVPYQEMKKTYWVSVEVINAQAFSDQVQNGLSENYGSVPINCEVTDNGYYSP